jgi:hypothetical protein
MWFPLGSLPLGPQELAINVWVGPYIHQHRLRVVVTE